jgi:hypothetical protein
MLVLFFAAVFLGFTLGMAVGVVVFLVSHDQELVGLVGTAVWMFSWILLHVYGFVWLYDPVRDKFNARAEGKLQTAEVRIGAVWAMMGGGLAMAAKASTLQVALIMIPCAIAGGLLGFDFKRRIRRKRERYRDGQGVEGNQVV